MRSSSYKKYPIHASIILIIIAVFGCNVDEIPPALASGLRGWFTIDENNIGVNISWYEVEEDDLARDSDFQKAKHIMMIVQNNEKANQIIS